MTARDGRDARRRHDRWQRPLDVAVAGAALVVLAPLLFGIALCVWLVDGRPVLFRQVRIGRGGRPFTLCKFRSMRAFTGGRLVTVQGDPRVTRLGGWLRRTKLDELPQLWHVLTGAMSLVGPRPEVPWFVAEWPEAYTRIAGLRPGLTDLASIAFAHEERVLATYACEARFYEERLLPRKLALARLYRRHRSVSFDLRILAATALRIAGAPHVARGLLGGALLTRVAHEPPPARRRAALSTALA